MEGADRLRTLCLELREQVATLKQDKKILREWVTRARAERDATRAVLKKVRSACNRALKAINDLDGMK